MRAEQVAVSADGSAFRCRELVGRDLWRVLRGRVCGTLAVAEVGAGAARAASPLASPVSRVVPPCRRRSVWRARPSAWLRAGMHESVCMCVCEHACACEHLHMCVCVYCACVSTCVRVSARVCVLAVSMCVCIMSICVCISMCACVLSVCVQSLAQRCMCVHVSACAWVFVCACVSTHVHGNLCLV